MNTTVALGCTSDFFGSTICIIPRSDTKRCPLKLDFFAIAVIAMAYNLTHEEFRNGEQWNAFYYPSLELLTQSTLAAIWIYRLVLPAVVIVYPPQIVTGTDPSHCHWGRMWFWLRKPVENINNSLRFFTFSWCWVHVFPSVLVMPRNSLYCQPF